MVRGSNPGGARFSAPIQPGPGAHSASCTMGTGSFLGVKVAGVWRWQPTPVKWQGLERFRAIPLLPLWAHSGLLRGSFTFTFYKVIPGTVYQSAHCHIPEDLNHLQQCCENLGSWISPCLYNLFILSPLLYCISVRSDNLVTVDFILVN